MTGGATPLHVCGMSRRGQLATEAFIKLGADLNVHDTCGGCAAGLPRTGTKSHNEPTDTLQPD